MRGGRMQNLYIRVFFHFYSEIIVLSVNRDIFGKLEIAQTRDPANNVLHTVLNVQAMP